MRSRPAHLASIIPDFRQSPLFSWFDLGSVTPPLSASSVFSSQPRGGSWLETFTSILSYRQCFCASFLYIMAYALPSFSRWFYFIGIRFTAMQRRSCIDSNGIVSWGMYDGNSTNIPFSGLIQSSFCSLFPCLLEKYNDPGSLLSSWIMSVGIET